MNVDERPRYMISVAADLVGMHPQTLRIYENKGLIRPKRLVESASTLRAEAEARVRTRPRVEGLQQQPTVSRAFSDVLDRASQEARSMQDEYVSTEHLLLALDVVPRDQLETKIKHI